MVPSLRAACAVALVVVLALSVGGVVLAQEDAPVPVDYAQSLELVVIDRSGMEGVRGTLWIASNDQKWSPRGIPSRGHVGATSESPGGWFFLLAREAVDRAGLEFKFTRGGWDTVEVAADGRDVPNRRLTKVDWSKATRQSPVITLELSVSGFADQRGTRWPALRPPGAPQPSSVVGDLEIFDFTSPSLKSTRKLRVWLPPGYKDPANAERRYPVLYMNDGQNVFDAATCFSGVEWGADETATALITAGTIPPMIIVGIDNNGPERPAEYNPPFTQWEGRDNRGDEYLAFVTDEVVPEIARRYRVLNEPRHRAIGGSSFGGNQALYSAIQARGFFGAILVESPALWIGNGRLMETLKSYSAKVGVWPQRVYIAQGTKEYDREADDRRLVQFTRELGEAIAGSGLDASRLKVMIEEGAPHHERAWAKRLPGAMTFLFKP